MGFNEDLDGNDIAKIYAERDMENYKKKWLKEKADLHYSDFKNLSIDAAVIAINFAIENSDVTRESSIELLENLIEIYKEYEEYERCSKLDNILKKIK